MMIALAVASWFPERRGRHWDQPKVVTQGRWALLRPVLPVAMVLVVGGST